MTRSRLFFTAPIVLAVVIIGVFAMRSRGDNTAKVDTRESQDCPPVARADAVATKPGTPISIDVLANDTDPDGDPLVFQILRTNGGESTIDDGGSPTDASDDRVLFTPADPPAGDATIEYQALDPEGAVGESTVAVTINDTATLPDGVHSEAVPTEDNGTSSDGCGTGKVSTTTTSTTEVTTSETTGTTVTGDATTPTTKKTTAKKPGSKTTTPKKPSSSSSSTSTTKPPTSSSTTATTQPPTSTTTATTQPDPCGAYPVDGSEEEQADWIACEQAHNGG